MAQQPETAAPAPLPPGLDLLWGRRERGRRGPKPGLSVDAIVEAAVRVADTEGLDAVSMARVAKELGFTTMSLYRHVASKDELLQLMWNASAQGAESLVLDGDGWRDRLRQWVVFQREALDQHPWITQMPMAAPPLAPNSLTFVERGLETLEGTGLAGRGQDPGDRPAQLLHAQRGADGARRGPGRGGRAGGGRRQRMPAAPPVTFEALVRQLVDEHSYPILHRLAWSAAIGDAPSGMDEAAEFRFGVECILDGVEKLIQRSAGRSG